MPCFAICDDEPYMQENLSALLAQHCKEPYQLQCFTSGKELLASAEDFDLLFLDIQMEAPNGMETARLLRQKGKQGLLVFVTVLQDCVFDAFSVEAFDYLLKPVDNQRFQAVLNRALSVLSRRSAQTLSVQRGGQLLLIPLSQIVYLEVLGRKIYLHQADGTVVDYYEKLENLEARLERQFFRCHRSFLVNLDFVRGCGGGQVRLASGASVPLSRLRERDFTQALLRHMAERGPGNGSL